MRQSFKEAFEKKMTSFIDENNLIKQGGRVIAALSGGSDSVCLLYALHSIKKYDIVACHVNHMIRPGEADGDERFCKDLCQKMQIPLEIGKFDVLKIAKEKKQSTELAAREVRYEFLKSVCKKYNADTLATAHNKNDNAETMIGNYIRGSGLLGLCGIEPKREEENIFIVRPILCMDKEEILTYLKESRQKFVTDSTNLKADCTRNKIRLELIKYIEKSLNPNFVKTITKSAESIKNDNDFIENEVLKHTKQCIFKDGDKTFIEKKELERLHKALRFRIIRKAAGEACKTMCDIGIDAVKRVDGLKSGSVNVKNGIDACLRGGRIYFEKQNEKEKKESFEYELCIDKPLYIKECQMTISAKLLDAMPAKKMKNSAYFDYGFLEGKKILFRSRKNGDFIHTEAGRKKLKDLFIDLKIPLEKRDKIAVMECEEEILWVCAARRCDKYKINQKTEKVLQISYTGEDKDEYS